MSDSSDQEGKNAVLPGNNVSDGATSSEEVPDRRQQLLNESGVLGWDELVKHFARGVVVRVGQELDLIDVAMSFCEDDTQAVTRFLESGAVQRASDDDARHWSVAKPDFRCVVTAPWVLVQELDSSITKH